MFHADSGGSSQLSRKRKRSIDQMQSFLLSKKLAKFKKEKVNPEASKF